LSKNIKNLTYGVVVIIDVDNFEATLRNIGLMLCNLKLFVSCYLKEDDMLIRVKSREGILYNPVIYIVSKRMGDEARVAQVEYFNKLKSECGDFLKLAVIDPKKSSSGGWHSCTDSEIAAFIAMALYDPEVNKIIIVSGDGDFLRPLERIGVIGKKITMIGVEGSMSSDLKNFVERHNGQVYVIKGKIPGLSDLPESSSIKAKTYPRFANKRIGR
jgi:hypothetical protein